jgi:hypothetical protein
MSGKLISLLAMPKVVGISFNLSMDVIIIREYFPTALF